MSAGLPIRQVAKPWGSDILPAPFMAPAGERIGEIWFEPPPELPDLLIKYIFTSAKLSVQVHPSDTETLAAGLGRQGKEECWLVIAAEPGAKLGIGFREPLTPEAMRHAARDGSIEQLIEWHTVHAGDFFYIPAGTVHAIGAGISLIEVQQNSDITYRLYDYGRPRELHLAEGIAVAHGERYAGNLRQHVPPHQSQVLVEGPLFRLDQIAGRPDDSVKSRYKGPLFIIPREGTVRINATELAAGTCGLAQTLNDVEFATSGTTLIAQPCQ